METKYKPFNLELAKQGHPVMTKDKKEARIVCFDRKGDKPLVVLVKVSEDHEHLRAYSIDGTYSTSDNSEDLVMGPKIIKAWVNIYKHNNTFKTGIGIHPSKDIAIAYSGTDSGYMGAFPIEIEE